MSDFTKYLDYIKNTGGNPSVAWFDDGWDPIGPVVRADMVDAGLIAIEDGKILVIVKA